MYYEEKNETKIKRLHLKYNFRLPKYCQIDFDRFKSQEFINNKVNEELSNYLLQLLSKSSLKIVEHELAKIPRFRYYQIEPFLVVFLKEIRNIPIWEEIIKVCDQLILEKVFSEGNPKVIRKILGLVEITYRPIFRYCSLNLEGGQESMEVVSHRDRSIYDLNKFGFMIYNLSQVTILEKNWDSIPDLVKDQVIAKTDNFDVILFFLGKKYKIVDDVFWFRYHGIVLVEQIFGDYHPYYISRILGTCDLLDDLQLVDEVLLGSKLDSDLVVESIIDHLWKLENEYHKSNWNKLFDDWITSDRILDLSIGIDRFLELSFVKGLGKSAWNTLISKNYIDRQMIFELANEFENQYVIDLISCISD